MNDTFLKLIIDNKPQILEDLRTPSRINIRLVFTAENQFEYPMPRCRQETRGIKLLTYRGSMIRITSDFFSETKKTVK